MAASRRSIPLSFASRSAIERATAWRSSSGSSPAPREAWTSGLAVSSTRTSACGRRPSRFAALGHDTGVRGGEPRAEALVQLRPDGGHAGDAAHRRGHARRADRLGHVDPADPHPALGRVLGGGVGEAVEGALDVVGDLRSSPCRAPPRQRAVGRSGVEEPVAELGGCSPRDARLAAAGRAVHRHDHAHVCSFVMRRAIRAAAGPLPGRPRPPGPPRARRSRSARRASARAACPRGSCRARRSR